MEEVSCLQQALKAGSRLQDILTSNYVAGKSGNDILRASSQQMESLATSRVSNYLGY